MLAKLPLPYKIISAWLLWFNCWIQWAKIFEIDSQVLLKHFPEEMLQLLVGMVTTPDTDYQRMHLHPRIWYSFPLLLNCTLASWILWPILILYWNFICLWLDFLFRVEIYMFLSWRDFCSRIIVFLFLHKLFVEKMLNSWIVGVKLAMVFFNYAKSVLVVL